MVTPLDLPPVLDIKDSGEEVITRQKVVHPRAPVVLPSDPTPICPVAIHQHAKWVQFPEGVCKVAGGQDLLKRVSFTISEAWTTSLSLGVIDVLVVPDYVKISTDNDWFAGLRF